MTSIHDSKSALEETLASVLNALLPQTRGYTLDVEILENERKKRSDASVESWRPAYGEIRIRFGRPSRTLSEPPVAYRTAPEDAPTQRAAVPESDSERISLIRALRAAEQRPGFEFVALKWFRDVFLPAQGYEWTEIDKDNLIRTAVNEQVALTYRVPNPKAPAFPVTAIRLNRQHPAVAAAMAEEKATRKGFKPVAIRGEPLSATILRDRR